MTKNTYGDLNAEVKLLNSKGEPQLEKDEDSVRAYFIENVNQNTVFFHSLEEKVDHLTKEAELWDEKQVLKYGFDALKDLMKQAYAHKYRFKTFMGAYKFYTSYALKTSDGKRYYERFEDRVVLTAIHYSEDLEHASRLVDLILGGYFQPATPTFLNAGLADAGKPVSCFIIDVQDNMESISRSVNESLQLSKRGGGVGIHLSNVRETGAPIKKRENQASGIIPVMKLYEDAFSYANQLGARQGAGVVYLNAHHPDILQFLDTKRENADEKIRIKTLSLGVIIPDVTFKLARENKEMALFSPYDVERVYGKPFASFSVTENYDKWLEDERISKKFINPRKFFQNIAQIQFESGYPYLMFDDAANRANPAPNVGRIVSSNLCSEIFQPTVPSQFNADGSYKAVGQDISCNLGSLNIARMQTLDNHDFAEAVQDAYEFLHQVAEQTEIESSPAIVNGNRRTRAIGLGQMNLHGDLLEQGLEYDSEEARDRFDRYMNKVTYYLIYSSVLKAEEEGKPFWRCEGSRWGEIIQGHQDYARDVLKDGNSAAKWQHLLEDYGEYGMANQHLQAIPPTGSISYINHATASIHPVTAPVEVRKEGKVGRVYYPQYGVTNENVEQVKNAFTIGPNAVIDMYAVAGRWVDQGMSLTLFFPDTATTRDVNLAQIYAHKKGLKSLYYIRTAQKALEGTEIEGCLSCML